MGLTSDDIALIRSIFIEGLETLVLPRFDAIDQRFESNDQRFDAMDKRFDRLEGHVDHLEYEMHNRFDELGGKMQALENDTKELYKLTARTSA